jgi:hypothetical protein
MRAIIYFGGKLLPFLGSKNEPSKKAAWSELKADLDLLVTALSSLNVLQDMDWSIQTLNLEPEYSRKSHFVLPLHLKLNILGWRA